MTVEVAICEQLLAASGLTALVGSRIYHVKLPQKPTLPAVRVQLIDEPRDYHLRGVHGSTRALVQVDAYAAEVSATAGYDPKATVDAVAAAIDAALSGQRFTNGSPATIEITSCFRDARRPLYDADDLRLLRVSQDYRVVSKGV